MMFFHRVARIREISCIFVILLAAFSSTNAYKYWLTGNSNDVSPQTTGGTVLMGGGSDVAEAFRWMIEKSGGGDFVVIRASGSDGYNGWIFNTLKGVNSVETILFQSREDSKNQKVISIVRNAEALFMAGGDQSRYVRYWKDSPVEDALNYLIREKKVPVGGTSAGCAVMTTSYYSALKGSLQSSDGLHNPFHRDLTIGHDDFLLPDHLDNTISDTHYHQRGREGRHMAFLARMILDFSMDDVKGIGVNEKTAVCIGSKGIARVFGSSHAFFLRQYCNGPEQCRKGQPLDWHGGVKVYKVLGNKKGTGSLDLKDWETGKRGSWEYWHVASGKLVIGKAPSRECSKGTSADIIYPSSLPETVPSGSLHPAVNQSLNLLGRIIPASPAAIGNQYFFSPQINSLITINGSGVSVSIERR